MTRENMTVALRVLSAVSDRVEPDQADVEILQTLVSPTQRNADPETLACLLINAELLQRKNKTMTAGAS